MNTYLLGENAKFFESVLRVFVHRHLSFSWFTQSMAFYLVNTALNFLASLHVTELAVLKASVDACLRFGTWQCCSTVLQSRELVSNR